MAFLLLLHQKMRLQRKENELTLKQLRFSSKVDRMQKKVDKRQKYYDKLRKQIERQANCYKNSMNIQISNMYGLGTNSVNLMNPYASNGAAQLALQNMDLSGIENFYGKDKVPSESELNAFKTAIKGGQLFQIPCEMDRETAEKQYRITLPSGVDKIEKGQLYDPNSGALFTAFEGEIYNKLQQQAQIQVSQMQTFAQNMKGQYENNVSIWTEAQLEQLEYQEQAEMDLLAEEQSDMEAEKNSVEVQLQRVQEEKKNIEQALGNAIQDSAPKFGLA